MHSCCSASFGLRDGSTQLGMEGKGPRDTSCALSSTGEYVIISAKWNKRKPLRKVLQGSPLYWHLFFKRAVDRKSSAGHILCLRRVIYEAWNWALWSSRHGAVTTRRFKSEEGGKAAHTRRQEDICADRKGQTLSLPPSLSSTVMST